MWAEIFASILKEAKANRPMGLEGSRDKNPEMLNSGMAPQPDQQQSVAPQPSIAAKIMGRPSGFSWENAANQVVPNIVQGGKFTPIAAMQTKLDPYFGQDGKYNFTADGPWRRK